MDIVKFFKCSKCLSHTHFLESDYRNWSCHSCDFKTGVTLDDLDEIEAMLKGIVKVKQNKPQITKSFGV